VDVVCLPEGDVKPGDTWSHEPAAEMEDLPFTVRVDHRLLEVTTRAGRTCAKLSVSWEAPFSDVPFPMGDGDVDASASGVMSGEYIVYYDYENCLEVHVEGAFGTTFTLALPEFSVEQKQQVNVKARLVE
jgi:hypothetical protein